MRHSAIKSKPTPLKTPDSEAVRAHVPAWLLALLLVLGTLAVYWPATHCNFINYDDPDYVTANPQVQSGLNLESVKWAFSSRVSGNWHPVTMLSHMLDCQLFGLNPWGPHLVNVLFHSVNVALVFVFLWMLTGATWRSLLVAALFAVHPLHVESVAWISERKDVLSGFFGLLSLIFYVRYARDQSGRLRFAPTRQEIERRGSSADSVSSLNSQHPTLNYALALSFFILGLMSKPMLVTWPFVFLLLDYQPLDRFKRGNILRLISEKIPFLVLAAAACAVTLLVQKQEGAVLSAGSLSPGARTANALISYSCYLGKLFWPTKLAVFYPLPAHWPLGEVLLAGGLILALSILFWVQRRHWPLLLTGWFWYLGTLVPVIGIVKVGEQAMADRYMYLPSVGLLILVVWGICELTNGLSRRGPIFAVISAGAIILCASVTRHQLGYWTNSETLFRHALAVTQDNAVSRNQLGTAFFNQDRLDDAINQYAEAIRLQPGYADPYFNLGNTLVKKGDIAEAIGQFQKYIRLNPNDAAARYNLATALYNQGQMNDAINQYREVIRLDPGNADAHNNLGIALGRTGQMEEAIRQFREVIRLKPDFAEARNNLGIALLNTGAMDEAIRQFQDAVRLNPRSVSAYNNLGIAMDREGKTDEAIGQYQQVIRLAPGSVEAYNNLGADLAAKGQLDAAIATYRQAIRIDPNRPDIIFRLGAALGQAGHTQEAIAQYREALRLNPNLIMALNNLAWALATSPDDQLRDGPEAVRIAERACELTQNRQPLCIGTLAAAYAEAGRFPDAITMAEKAVKLATDAGLTQVAAENRRLLEIYHAGKAYHEKAPTGH